MERAANLGTAAKSATPSPAATMLRRKCACGSHTPGGSACPKCDTEPSLLRREAETKDKPPETPPPGPEPLPPLIDDQRSKTEEEKTTAALGKFGAAFLETDLGGKITDKAAEFAFGSTPQAVFSGVAIGATITGLALKHQELPFPIPAIPLNAISKKFPPGLTLELTWNGPVNRPTDGSVVLKFAPPKPEKGKPDYTAITAAMARDQDKFRSGMAPPPGSAEARAQEAQDKAIRDYVLSRPGAVDVESIIKKNKSLGGSSPGPLQLIPPSQLGPGATGDRRPPLTLGEEFKLKPPDDLRKREDGPALQKKLAIGATDDPLEAEADRAADQALAQPPGGVAGRAAPKLQRRDSGGGGSAGSVPESVERTLSGSGRPLDTALRADMEARFDHDFSQVRVHSDASAARSAHDVGAHAYTAGQHIAFATGKFSPGSGEGKRLLAHELAHVVQQAGEVRNIQRQCVSSACPPVLIPINALYPVYDAAEKCIQTLYTSSHPAKPGVSLSFNADWLHLTGGRPQEKMALACARGLGTPEPGTKGAGPNFTAKSGMFAAQPDIWDFLSQTMYEITTPAGAGFRISKLAAEVKLANQICGTQECGGLMFDPGTWAPPAGCFALGGDLYFTATNSAGVIIYNMFKDGTKEAATLVALALVAAAIKNLPTAGAKTVTAVGGKLAPALAVAGLVATAILLTSGRGEAKPGPGEDPLVALYKSLEQKGSPVPPEIKAMIDSNPELKAKLTKAMAEGGDLTAAQEEISREIAKTIAANKDQFTQEELEILLATTQSAGKSVPNSGATVQELKQLAAAAKAGKTGTSAKPGTTGGGGSDDKPAAPAVPKTETPAVPGKSGSPAAPAAEPEVSPATRERLDKGPAPARKLLTGLTGTGPKARKLNDAQMRRFLDMVPPGLTDDQVEKLLARRKVAENETADQILDTLQAALNAPGEGKGTSDATGDSPAPPGPAEAPPTNAPPPRKDASTTTGPTVNGGAKTDPAAVVRELAAKARDTKFDDLAPGKYNISYSHKKSEPIAVGSTITGSVRGKLSDKRTYVGRIEAEVTAISGEDVKIRFVTSTPMVGGDGKVIFQSSEYVGREDSVKFAPSGKK